MASNLLLIVLFLLVSLSLTSGYVHSSRDVVSTQDDEATNDVARSLQALLVAVSKKGSSGGSRSSSRSSKSIKKIGALDLSAFIGIVIGAIVGTIVLLAIIYCLISVYLNHQEKKAQSIEQGALEEETNELSETQTFKTEEINRTLETQTSKTENINGSLETQTSKT